MNAPRRCRISGDRSADLYGPQGPSNGLVVLLHGRGADERSTMAALAREVAARAAWVFVPDWRPDAPDQGRDDLCAAFRVARREFDALGFGPERVVIAGWSRGANAAFDIVLSDALGWSPGAVVGISGGYRSPGPVSGRAPLEAVSSSSSPPLRATLVHGTLDERVAFEQTRSMATALRTAGWPVRLAELDVNHAGAVMTRFDPAIGRCVPSTDPQIVAAGMITAAAIAQATL